MRKRYPPREPGGAPQDLWRGLDLTIDEGEFVAVEGQSGTGKSTLLHILGGLDRAYQGDVHVLGAHLGHLSDASLSALRHARIGFVFQSFNLLPELTALENVLLPDFFGNGIPDADRRARDALERVGLSGKGQSRPTALSGGERQRVAIARALLAGPSLLLADEPTGNLDARTGEGIIGLFRELHREGMTLLVVTHEVRVSRAASRVLVLRDGVLMPDPRLEGSA
ncbi:MAG TPA: ABC transporter ATP-binding protein [Myxococcales bacterium]|nr:ABC transporter ATP-binding protein [Myxococcales bacterium]